MHHVTNKHGGWWVAVVQENCLQFSWLMSNVKERVPISFKYSLPGISVNVHCVVSMSNLTVGYFYDVLEFMTAHIKIF